ncbi:MAG: hypothetical protein ACREJC_03785 [Tepidisphaeraceae bacterium]
MVTQFSKPKRPCAPGIDPWPAEVDLILSAMDAGAGRDLDRRSVSSLRMAYRVRAALRLFCDPDDARPWLLYSRDVDPRGLGFITPHRLPLGYGGTVELFSPRGRKLRVDCLLSRCRQVAPGWYEGALNFNREQHVFAVE